MSAAVLFSVFAASATAAAENAEVLCRRALANDAVSADELKAAAWAGAAPCQAALGQRYLAGRGVARAPVQAYVYLCLASDQGLQGAITERDEVERSMNAADRERVDAELRRRKASVGKG